ncbi:MAG: 50S ribosomal protein L21, partial [FCB group bacterium]|nr:50S ribosomal protein L21 [FCB group bacterium]
VLLVKDNDNISVGTPYIDDAKIEAEIINAGKNDKVLIYKYKRRTKYRRTQGHRQAYNEIKINKIITS